MPVVLLPQVVMIPVNRIWIIDIIDWLVAVVRVIVDIYESPMRPGVKPRYNPARRRSLISANLFVYITIFFTLNNPPT